MAKFELQPDENLIKEETAIYIKNKIIVQPGRMYLTTKRLVFIKSYNYLFGLIGLLFKTLRGGILFDIPLKDIIQYENAKYGINKKVLGLKLQDGREPKFVLSSKYEEWEQALKSAGK